MYLLNLRLRMEHVHLRLNLHSTMYLINPVAATGSIGKDVFTFHYVSIKS